MSVRTGLDNLRAEPTKYLKGPLRVGLLVNHAAVDRTLTHAVDILRAVPGVEIAALFAPEHGLWGTRQDMATIAASTDPRTGVPIHSLYGSTEATLAPSPESLQSVDLLIIDLPDIGTRYYTFAQTALYCLRVAKQLGLPVLILDRPNPLNGTTVEGPPLTASCRSFCGYAPTPVRHGLTLGELAEAMNQGFTDGLGTSIPPVGAELHIAPVTGWNRAHYHDENGLPWVLPSPNMPTLDAAIVYPGGCLIEGTELSEGRGTTRPFEFVGAPGVDPWLWEAAVKQQGIPLSGAVLRHHAFEPAFQKHRGETCFGFQVHISDRQVFQPIRWFIALLGGLRDCCPTALVWRTHAYEFVNAVPAIDLLWGSDALRRTLDEGRPVASLIDAMEASESDFLSLRAPFLRYR